MKPKKPPPMKVLEENIPADLKAGVYFVTWNWVWREGKKKWDKPPYNPRTGKPAKTNDPTTWSDFLTVFRAWQGGEYDGVGRVITPPYVGVDLDNCRNVQTGEISQEAQEIIDTFDSYSEVSPSGAGVKMWGRGKLPPKDRRGNNIEMYEGGRYFTITGQLLDGTYSTIGERQEQLEEIHKKSVAKKRPPQNKAARPTHNIADADLLEKAKNAKHGDKFRALWEGNCAGYPSPSEADLALCSKLAFWVGPDPARIDTLFRQSGLNRDKWEDREDYRTKTIDKAIADTPEFYSLSPASTTKSPPAEEPDTENLIRELNEKHAVVMLGGKCLVMNEIIEPVFNRPDITFSTMTDFRAWYAKRKIPVGDKWIGLAKLWLESPERREYNGIVFDPQKQVEGHYNLWRDFAVEPKAGDWSMFQNHVFENICRESYELFDYLMAWMAHIVQEPGGERPGVAPVLRGSPGVGKGVMSTGFGLLFGSHFLHITNPKQLTGRFNNHLKDALVVFCDEAIWAGDKAAEGVLKGMITEPFIMVEPKGKDAFAVKNRIRLIVASNADWVIPAGLQDRRFMVLDVGDARQRDHKYFREIVNQMNEGGRAAMLHDLLKLGISKTDLRDYPQTEALLDQKIRSMTTVQKFWFECLQDGKIGGEGWPLTISTKGLYREYRAFADDMNDRWPAIDKIFFKELKRIVPTELRKHRAAVGIERQYVYQIPDLETCRECFEKQLGSEINWEDI